MNTERIPIFQSSYTVNGSREVIFTSRPVVVEEAKNAAFNEGFQIGISFAIFPLAIWLLTRRAR